MDYLPPGRVVRIGDERFPRFVIRDGLGQYWARDHWSDAPGEAVLFSRETDAMEARNSHCLGGDQADTFTVTMTAVVTVHAHRWSKNQLARFLKRHRQFCIGGPPDKEGILLEILPGTLKKVEG
jgi:hypothetical protein